MWIERTIGLDLTIHVDKSHVKVYVENCSTKWGVGQMLTKADEGGRGGKPYADHCRTPDFC